MEIESAHISLPPSAFNGLLIRWNGLLEAGFAAWEFLPGMRFNERNAWWRGGADRGGGHEGLDICWYRTVDGQRLSLLAGARVPADERQARWLEPLPAVEIADRLRRIPLFAHVSVDELFRLAGSGRHRRHGRGHTICAAGCAPDALHLLVDGTVALGDTAHVHAPAALFFDEAIESSPLAADIRAVDVATTIALDDNDFLTLLSNDVAIADGLFRCSLWTCVNVPSRS